LPRHANKTSFQPGKSYNPGGKPRTDRPPKPPVAHEIARERTREAVIAARHAAPAAIRRLVHLVDHGETDAVKLSAANSLLDRALGKPVQGIDINAQVRNLNEMTAEQLRALRERWLATSVPLISQSTVEIEAAPVVPDAVE
jgi:hypothetical protein